MSLQFASEKPTSRIKGGAKAREGPVPFDKENNVTKERPQDLQGNNRTNTFRARPHPANPPTSPGQSKSANVVKVGESPS